MSMRTRLWWWASRALAPLCRLGLAAPYAWAHCRWLDAHTAAVARQYAVAGYRYPNLKALMDRRAGR